MKLYPATQTQAYICGLAGDQANPSWRVFNIALAVRVKPSVDLRRLHRAFHAIQMRHDVFRTSFVNDRSGWRVGIHDTARATVRIHDHGPTPTDQQAAHLTPHVNPFRDLERDPLVSMDLFRFGLDGDVVLVQVHHAITDGFGFLVALDEFAALLLNQPATARPVSFKEYRRLTQTVSKPDLVRRKTYWQSLMRDPPAPPDFGSTIDGHPRPDPYIARECEVTTISLTADESDHVAKLVKSAGATTFSRVAAAFHRTIQDLSGADDIFLSSNLGRMDARLSEFAGLHTLVIPLRCHGDMGQGMARLSKSVRDQVQSSVAHMPYDPIGPTGVLSKSVERTGASMRQFGVHLERSENRQSQSLFFELLKHGKPMKLFGAFEFQGVPLPDVDKTFNDVCVVAGQTDAGLDFHFERDTGALSQAQIQNVMTGFRENILRAD